MGKKIYSMATNEVYREHWEQIFGKDNKQEGEQDVEDVTMVESISEWVD